MSPEKKATISQLINQAITNLPPQMPLINDKQTLIAHVLCQELENELEILNAMLSADDFEQEFRSRCAYRAQELGDSLLSFPAMPSSACNQLYFKIATILFKPNTMHEMLAILLPQATIYLTHTASLRDETQRWFTGSLIITFEREDISALDAPATLETFSSFVVCEDTLINLAEIAAFNFNLHQAYYEALRKSYPNMALRLYQHNTALKSLSDHLQMSSKGQSPLTVISSFIRSLILGGTKATNALFATPATHQALVDFLLYLESLPKEFQNRLLGLSGADAEKTLAYVIDKLRKGDCVETAARQLREITEKASNFPILMTYPKLSPTYLQALRSQYRSGSILSTAGDATARQFPTSHLRSALAHIKINNAFDLMRLLLSFPIELYSPLLQQVEKISPLLSLTFAYCIKNNILGREQTDAFFKALICSKKIPLPKIIEFSKACYKKQSGLFKALFENISMERLLSSEVNLTELLRYAMGYPELYRAILEKIPAEGRLNVLQYKDSRNRSLLYWATQNLQLWEIILELLPKEVQLIAVTEEFPDGYTLLHRVANDLEWLQLILAVYPVEDRLWAINQRDGDDGNTVLHLAASHPSALKELLQYYPAEALPMIAGELLPKAMPNINSLKILFPLISRGEWVTIVCALLPCALDYPDSFGFILESLSEPERIRALHDGGFSVNKLVDMAKNNNRSLPVVLKWYPKSVLISQLEEKSARGLTWLQEWCLANPAWGDFLRECCPEAFISPEVNGAFMEKELSTETSMPIFYGLLRCNFTATNNPLWVRAMLLLTSTYEEGNFLPIRQALQTIAREEARRNVNFFASSKEKSILECMSKPAFVTEERWYEEIIALLASSLASSTVISSEEIPLLL